MRMTNNALMCWCPSLVSGFTLNRSFHHGSGAHAADELCFLLSCEPPVRPGRFAWESNSSIQPGCFRRSGRSAAEL